MGRKRKKNLHYGSKKLRTSVADRTAPEARPWNDPEVVKASTIYAVPFASYRQVHNYENRIQDVGNINPDERLTCRPCGKFKGSCECNPIQPELPFGDKK